MPRGLGSAPKPLLGRRDCAWHRLDVSTDLKIMTAVMRCGWDRSEAGDVISLSAGGPLSRSFPEGGEAARDRPD